MGPGGRRAGSSLIEITIVMAMVGILVATSSPFQHRSVDDARSAVTRAHLRNTLFAEITFYLDNQTFTNDRSELLAIDPSLPLGSESVPSSIFIALSSAAGAPAICLFAESTAGEWHTLYYSTATDETSDLASPNDCTRRMLDEQLTGDPNRVHERTQPDTLEPTARIGS